ncbi:alpha%2C alpha-trehalose-phosphate synthase [Mycobacterium tuberculosis]|nr:alpha%2C alpha-trehalose-phosphate synthase [Mycobacterium tuberculosis]
MAPSGGQEAQICDSETFGDSDFVVVARRLGHRLGAGAAASARGLGRLARR